MSGRVALSVMYVLFALMLLALIALAALGAALFFSSGAAKSERRIADTMPAENEDR